MSNKKARRNRTYVCYLLALYFQLANSRLKSRECASYIFKWIISKTLHCPLVGPAVPTFRFLREMAGPYVQKKYCPEVLPGFLSVQGKISGGTSLCLQSFYHPRILKNMTVLASF